MDAANKRKAGLVLFRAVVLVAAFGSTIRLLSDDVVPPGPGGVLLFASALFCIGAMGLASSLNGRVRLGSIPLLVLVALFLALGTLTCTLAAPTPFLSFACFLPLAGNLLFFFVVLYAGRDREFGKFILKGALGAVLIQCVLGIYQFYSSPARDGFGNFRGTYATSPHIAGVLAMCVPVAAGLLMNSVHERLDRSIWPRRVVYSLALIVTTGALYYAGSAVAWIVLVPAMGLALLWTGRTYLARNRPVVLACAAVVLLLAVAATVLQTQEAFRIPGYAETPMRLRSVGENIERNLAFAARSPLLGEGYELGEPYFSGPSLKGPELANPGVFRLAAEGGFLAALLFLCLCLGAFVLFWRDQKKIPPVEGFDPKVVVGKRRSLKGIELTSLGILGGAIAFLAFSPGLQVFSRPAFLLLFLPLWLLFLTVSYSYKHFQLVVENQRDFVAIGAAAGASFGLLYSFLEGDLMHPPSQFLLLLLLGVAASRTLGEARVRKIDIRSPKFVRPILGAFCSCLCLSAVVMAALLWPLETRKTRLFGEEREEGRTFMTTPRRVREIRNLARAYRRDGHLWSHLGEARLKLYASRQWASDRDDAVLLEQASEDFRRASELSRSWRVEAEEGWAWMDAAAASPRSVADFVSRACAAFRTAVARAPDVPEPHAGLGEALFLLGERGEALEAFREALRLSDENPSFDRLPPWLLKRVRVRLGEKE